MLWLDFAILQLLSKNLSNQLLNNFNGYKSLNRLL
jgi:hypothetical protein